MEHRKEIEAATAGWARKAVGFNLHCASLGSVESEQLYQPLGDACSEARIVHTDVHC